MFPFNINVIRIAGVLLYWGNRLDFHKILIHFIYGHLVQGKVLGDIFGCVCVIYECRVKDLKAVLKLKCFKFSVHIE